MITMSLAWFLLIAMLLIAGGAGLMHRVLLEVDDRADAREQEKDADRDAIVDVVAPPRVPQQRTPEGGAR